MTSLNNRTALLTGSARGIGRAIAERHAALGAYVVVNHSTGEAQRRDPRMTPQSATTPPKESIMNMETYRPGAPCWAELTSDDPAAARAFYGALLGWRFANVDPANADGAVICALGDSPVGVIERAGDGQPSRWTSYLYVDDIEQTLDRIIAEGGTLARPPRAAAGGRRVATFTDAAGVVLGLLELGAAEPSVVGKPGALIWGELITDDVEASAAFYRAVFGWELNSPQGPLNRREWLVGGQRVGGLLPRPEAMPPEVPVYWDTWFGSADPDGAARLAPDLGGTLLMGPVDTEHGRLSVLTDPSGAAFSVSAPPPDPRPRSERA